MDLLVTQTGPLFPCTVCVHLATSGTTARNLRHPAGCVCLFKIFPRIKSSILLAVTFLLHSTGWINKFHRTRDWKGKAVAETDHFNEMRVLFSHTSLTLGKKCFAVCSEKLTLVSTGELVGFEAV